MDKIFPEGIEISIVVPVYRSEAILPVLAGKVLEEMRRLGLDTKFELILVNDDSPDGSWAAIERLAAEYAFVKGISLMKNAGQHNATMAGLGCARGEIVVIMDDDLQHPPEAIKFLLEAIRAGNDVCYTRYNHRQHKLWKKAGSRFNDIVATLILKKPPGLYLSSFKALHRRVVDEIVKYDGPYAYVDGLILDVTRRIASVDIAHQARYEGEGNYDLRRLVSLWLKMATSFSVFPLRVASVIGMIVSLLSVFLIIGVVVEKILHPETPAGWASMAALVLFMGGVQLFALGIMGEYVGRSYLRINRKPQYVIRSRTDGPQDGK